MRLSADLFLSYVRSRIEKTGRREQFSLSAWPHGRMQVIYAGIPFVAEDQRQTIPGPLDGDRSLAVCLTRQSRGFRASIRFCTKRTSKMC